MKRHVVLVLPSFRDQQKLPRKRVPANLLSIAAELIGIPGLETEVLDAETLGWGPSDVSAYLGSREPDLVGISICSPAYHRSLELVSRIRSGLPEALIVLGGKHVTHCWQELAIDSPHADILVVGEGEAAMGTLGKGLAEGMARQGLMASADRLRNTWIRGSSRHPELPPPYDLLTAPARPFSCLTPELDYYLGDRMLIEYSRGCPGQCTYCLAPRYRHGVSFRSVEAIIAELQGLCAAGFNSFFFTDDDFALSPRRLERLCQSIIDAKLGLQFDANVRPDSMLRCAGIAELIFDAGCRCLWLGIETGNTAIARSYAKGFSLETCQQGVAVAFRASRLVRTNWLIGAPEEREDTVADSISFAHGLRRIGPHLPHISFLIPYPGSPLYDQVLKMGLVTREELGKVPWLTHARALMPSAHLSKDALDQLYVRFHEELYADSFLKSASSEVAREAALILKSANIEVCRDGKSTDSGMVVSEDGPKSADSAP